jgi:hypothetical protein
MESGVDMVIEEQNYIADLETKLAKLQAKSERIARQPDGCRPPVIKTDMLKGIAKQMDKLEAEICSRREKNL